MDSSWTAGVSHTNQQWCRYVEINNKIDRASTYCRETIRSIGHRLIEKTQHNQSGFDALTENRQSQLNLKNESGQIEKIKNIALAGNSQECMCARK